MNKEMDCRSPDQSSHFLLLNNPEIMSNQQDITQVSGNMKPSSFNDLLPKNVWLEVVSQGIMGSREG